MTAMMTSRLTGERDRDARCIQTLKCVRREIEKGVIRGRCADKSLEAIPLGPSLRPKDGGNEVLESVHIYRRNDGSIDLDPYVRRGRLLQARAILYAGNNVIEWLGRLW